MKKIVIDKPKNYKSSRIIYDQNFKLIIDTTGSHFQLQQDLKEFDDPVLEVTDTLLIITESES